MATQALGHGTAADSGAPEGAMARTPSPPVAGHGTDESARFRRMERVTVLYAQITAATREFLRAVAACDRHEDWAEEGFACCADWLAWQIGVTRGTAREKVRAARALEDLPLISGAMARGEISFSKVRALTRVARPECEAELLEFARATSTAGLERVVRGWKAMDGEGEQKMERMHHRLRRFSVYPDGTGMYEVRGKLTAEVAAVLMRAVEAASDALYRAPAPADTGGLTRGAAVVTDEDPPEPEQLRADALGLLAERALAAGLSGRDGGDVPISGSRAERYQVVLHVAPEALSESGESACGHPDTRGPGRRRADMSELDDGTRVSAETSRRLSCDASRVVVTKNPDGGIVGVGRRTRTIPPALRRALEARDRGCRFPGCGLRFTDAHHIEHWADGGATSLDNTVLLCRRHHRLVHEAGHRICMDADGHVVFFSPSGGAIAAAGRLANAPLGDDPVGDLIETNRQRGTAPAWDTIRPTRHRRSPIPWQLEADAWFALDRAAESAADGKSPADAESAA